MRIKYVMKECGRFSNCRHNDWPSFKETIILPLFLISSSSSSIDADVVFVHGLRGGPFMTWRQQEEKGVKNSGTDCWPKVCEEYAQIQLFPSRSRHWKVSLYVQGSILVLDAILGNSNISSQLGRQSCLSLRLLKNFGCLP